MIVLREARGNISYLTGNEIVLVHKGGEILQAKNVKVIIRGEGKEAMKTGGNIDNASLGSILIIYNNLEGYNYVNSFGKRKDRYFLGYEGEEYARIVYNNTWLAGRKVVLYGADGHSSNQINNVDKKWELNPGSIVTVIIDIPSNMIISVSSGRVKQSKQVIGY